MKTGAVIVSAGMSSRMTDFKPLMKIGSISMVERIITNFQQANIFPIVLVTGYRGSELEKALSKTGILFVRNKEYQTTEMFDSAKLGFSFIKDKCDRTFFTPVDIPLFTLNTISNLLKSSAPIAKPVCEEKEGHPILISNRLLDGLIKDNGHGGLKKAIDRCGFDIEKVEVNDDGILYDADTQHDFDNLVKKHNEQLFRPSIEISLMCENKLFDKNGERLLKLIEFTGTVKEACEKMQISYSKAWGILSDLEKNLGFALVERKSGGDTGGKSRLTQEGKKLLAEYENFTEKVQTFASGCFNECFKRKIT
ncbi:MAG: NTP transferase domain-containing protein [Spirochaetales bacterium]|nr:NTP transferase domain-containing protein [Spirochaetales bacterium]